jgi:hypothetical protein
MFGWIFGFVRHFQLRPRQSILNQTGYNFNFTEKIGWYCSRNEGKMFSIIENTSDCDNIFYTNLPDGIKEGVNS